MAEFTWKTEEEIKAKEQQEQVKQFIESLQPTEKERLDFLEQAILTLTSEL